MTPTPDGADTDLGRVLILGGGAVGTMVAAALGDRSTGTTVIDRQSPRGGSPTNRIDHVIADVRTDVDFAAWSARLRAASIIVLSLPEPVVEAVLPRLAEHARADTLLIETCSVKSEVAALLGDLWSARPALGINPLFRPSLGLAGRRVAVVTYEPGGPTEAVRGALVAAGAALIDVGVVEHDRMGAVTQALTHACLLVFGAAVAECGTGSAITTLMAVAPPPFRALLSLSARVAAGELAVYREIQTAPGGARVRAAMDDAAAALENAVGTDADFERFRARILEGIGPDLVTELAATSETLLSGLG